VDVEQGEGREKRKSVRIFAVGQYHDTTGSLRSGVTETLTRSGPGPGMSDLRNLNSLYSTYRSSVIQLQYRKTLFFDIKVINTFKLVEIRLALTAMG